MIKLLNNKLFKILLAPVLGLCALWGMSSVALGLDATIPVIISCVGLFLGLVNSVYVYREYL